MHRPISGSPSPEVNLSERGGADVPVTDDIGLETVLLGERVIRLNVAKKLFPKRDDGRHISKKTIYRYILKGKNGIKLEVVKMPSGMATTIEAVQRFIARLNEGRQPTTQLTPARRRRQIAAATKRVEALLGITGGEEKR